MQRSFFCLLALFMTLAGFAQSTTNAEVAVTIVNPVGVTEVPEANMTLPVSLFARTKTDKTQVNHPQVEIASFKIAAGNNYYTLSLPSLPLRMVDQLNKNSFLLENLQIASVASQQAVSYTLNSSPVAQKQVSPGHYFNSTQLDITIHFN